MKLELKTISKIIVAPLIIAGLVIIASLSIRYFPLSSYSKGRVISDEGTWEGQNEHGDCIFLVTAKIENIGADGTIFVTCRMWDNYGSLWKETQNKEVVFQHGETKVVSFQIVVPIELAGTWYNLRWRISVS